VTPRRPDILIYCEGSQDSPHTRLLIERYRWKTDQAVWVQTVAGHAEILIYPGNTTQAGVDGSPPDRRIWQHHCPACHDELPVPLERMAFVLALATGAGRTGCTLRSIRASIDELPKTATLGGRYPAAKLFKRKLTTD